MSALAQATELYAAGRYADALPFAQQAATTGFDGAVMFGKVLQELARYDEAAHVWEHLAAVLREAEEPADLIAQVLSNWALARKYGGAPQAAVELYAEAEGLLRAMDPPSLRALATVVNNRGETLAVLGRYDDAARASDEALAIQRALTGDAHPDYARVLTARARLCGLQGRYDEAEARLEQALSIYRATLGDEHPEVANALHTLGGVLSATGRTRDARDAFERSLATWRRVFGGDRHPRVAVAMSNVAGAELELGRIDRAAPLYDAALEILQSTVGDDDTLLAVTLEKLAQVRFDTADYARATELFERAAPIWERAFGPRHPDLAKCLTGLAACRSVTGDLEAAIALSRRALAMYEATLGAEHPETPRARVNLAQLLIRAGRQAEARPLLDQARATIERVLGPTTPLLGQVLDSLGGLEQTSGRQDAAVAHFERAVAIRTAAFGEEHPDVADVLHSLAVSHAAAGRHELALRTVLRATRIDDELRGRVLATLSDRERIAFLQRARRELHTLLSLVLAHFADDPRAVRRALDAVLQRKGLAAEALAAQRDALIAHGDPDLHARLQALRALRAELAARTLAGDPRARALAEERDELERALAREIPELAQATRLAAVDHAAVARALPAGTALVEMVVLNRFDFAATPPDWAGRRYLAFVVRADGTVTLVDLGPDGAIDAPLQAYLEPLSRRGAAARHVGASRPPAATPDGRAVRERVLDPLLPALGDARRLLVSPDGGLTRLPLESLPAADGWVLDAYEISYLSAGRDLLRAPPAIAAGDPVVIADPDYDLGLGASPPAAGPRFEPLPGTAREGRQVAARLGVAALTGPDVLERTVKALRGPAVLHIATHGFFLADAPERALPLGAAGAQNALLRSGLALAGANARLSGLPLPPEAEDGVLYAEDVTALDLVGTELVVLSACDSGLGDVRAGEGVFGLRRAFALAGAETVVMSLWPVADAVTQELMGAFYVALATGTGRAEALRVAQREIRRRHPDVADWGAFICEGETGPLYRKLLDVNVIQ